ncbi:chemotaxis protein CheB [Paraburkholderia acidiphila]|uniref:Response regulator n=1 Tax=Paraburkholderia acidiphila TaxID=2571747 RepID=A0A7Z2GDQ4_9BURK|nr:chemotaxis protein CheB [Paraburkholderia acidiphila]QGZ59952.1 response regulator [Paraburkholderia acidiphila]
MYGITGDDVTQSAKASDESTSPTFPLVGIGASAGGLEAISELMADIPVASGMAFLVVQHLDPSRHSILPEILARRVSMPVVEAADGMDIEVNHLYVIPANASMSVAQRRIRLRPRDATLGPPMPVDDLLDSLAMDQGSNAIGVVLSGSGSDGALGLQAIQREGGITFAQDEGTAHFNSMPRAAISKGCVDRVLAPRDIAKEIIAIGRHPYLRSVPAAATGTSSEPAETSLRAIFRLLRQACNIDFSRYKNGTVQRRLARRMALRQVTSVADYVTVLASDPAETLALGRDLLIQVTEFFRDPETFEVLTQTVFPRLVAGKEPTDPFRIWVPGCATGEEVYSIAICLIEYLGEHAATTTVQIFGTDISAEALEVARTGRYIENIARNVSPERLERFFVREGEYYCIDKQVRDLCTFSRHDVLSDPPFSRMDLVSCRNLLIYLSGQAQRNVMPLFHYALKLDGVLMLGPSETVGAFSELFGVIENRRSRLYSKKPRLGPPAQVRLHSTRAVPAVPAESARESRSEPREASSLQSEVDRITLARYAPSSVLCDDDLNIVEYRGDTSAWLVNPSGPPTSNLQRLARPEVYLAVSEGVRKVRQDGVVVRTTGLRTSGTNGPQTASVEVHPVQMAGIEGRWFLIFFESGARDADGPGGQVPLKALLRQAIAQRLGRRAAAQHPDPRDEEIARLMTELGTMRTQIRTMLEEHESAREELKSSEEELLSSNEEFQSTNEELETAKEELQSLNEELSTTNDELRYRNHELRVLHDEVALARDYADAIIDTMAEPLLVLESDLRVTRANHAFYKTFQTSAEDTIGALLYTLGNGQWNIPGLRDLLEEVLPEQTVVRDFQITHDFPRIGVRTMRLNGARVVGRGQARILLTIEDTTEHRLAVQRLETADHQKDDFLAMLAHELRNPLAAIANAVEVWGHENIDPETQRQARALARRQLDHEIGLVDDLLDVSRITRGIIKLNVQPVNLVEIVQHGVAAMRAEIDARGHDVTLVLPREVLAVEGDAIRLEQIVTNLLSNAVKYTPPDGTIEVALVRDGDEAVLTVADNGIGMAADFLPTIFTLFVQAERSLDRTSAGLGLGLALVRKLVGLHHGTVQASSAGPGRGSTLVVRLPAPSHISAPLTSIPEAPRERPVVATQRILVVDDNPDAGESTAMVLKLDGHEVKVASNGPSALKCAMDFQPDFIVLDIGLPEMDGYEVARRLRAMPRFADTLLIAVSGYAGEEYRERAKQAGFNHYLVKPAGLAHLNQLIASSRSAGPAYR